MKARNYREVKGQAYTRRKYIRGSPVSKIVKFTMGDTSGIYKYQARLIAERSVQIRHNALESARITVNRAMEKKAGSANYRLVIRVYPHAVLRENKQATGAGADRVSQGMRAAYGKNVGTAAQIQPNQTIITIETFDQFIEQAKASLRKAGMKIPSPCKVSVGA